MGLEHVVQFLVIVADFIGIESISSVAPALN